jgi:disulfide bond formation protein DsbB
MEILTLNWLVSVGAVLMQGGAVGGVLLLLLRTPSAAQLRAMAALYALPLASFIAVVGTVITFVYSEHYGVIPCGLCWMERAFLYPLAIMLPLALWRRESAVVPYAIALSVVGGFISLYHHYIQMGGGSVLPCPASGGDCAKRFIFEFNYITFPLIALSSFAFIIVLLLIVRRAR